MSLHDLLRGWSSRVDATWPAFSAELSASLARARSGEASWLLPSIADDLVPALLVAHPDSISVVAAVAPVLSLAISQEDHSLAPDGSIGFAPLALVSAVNAFACAGAQVEAQTWSTMREWLPRLAVSRDDAWTTRYWSSGFAALALDVPSAYRRVAAEEMHGEALTFSPGLSFEFNLQGLLRYLRGAIQRQASLEDVTAAWEGFLNAFEPLWRAHSVDTRTLFWVGRLVFHHIGGRPLREVARSIHDSIWTHAGLEP